MQIDLRCHITINPASSPDPRISALVAAVQALTGNVTTMTTALEDLATEVSEEKTIMASAVTLIEGFSARLAAAGTDPAALAALRDELNSSGEALAAAVAANTPAA